MEQIHPDRVARPAPGFDRDGARWSGEAGEHRRQVSALAGWQERGDGEFMGHLGFAFEAAWSWFAVIWPRGAVRPGNDR